MTKRILLAAILCVQSVCASVWAQDLKLVGEVEDGFLHKPLTDVKITVMNPDSTVVTDSVSFIICMTQSRMVEKVLFSVAVKAEKHDYLLRASRKGYEDAWQTVSVLSPDNEKRVTVPTFQMHRHMGGDLKEVVATATRVKMYHKGDTIVYDADAFKLPDGSMLDALIRQLPGVTIDDDGQIFVNGRKVDELLLGARSFMRGNKKVLMENLPYYTVKDLKVYEKQSDVSEALGFDVGSRKYVMDVNLKDEFSQGYIANVEAAGGTKDRFLGRGFLLGFTNLWRYTLMANGNNVSESRHIGEHGEWSPDKMPKSIVTTRSVATDIDFQSSDKKVKDNFNVNYTSTTDHLHTRQRQELFLNGFQPTSSTESRSRNTNGKLSMFNHLTMQIPSYLNIETQFDYAKQHGSGFSQYEQWDTVHVSSMRSDLMSEARTWTLTQRVSGAFSLNKEKQWYTTYLIWLYHNDNQQWLSTRYDMWHVSEQVNSVRHNANDIKDRDNSFMGSFYNTSPELLGKMNLVVGDLITYSCIQAHDYLYHPDTLVLASQLDMLTAITDASNSYDKHYKILRNEAKIKLTRTGAYHIGPYNISYDRWDVGVDIQTYRRSLDYQRGTIDTLLRNNTTILQPHVEFRYMAPDYNHDLRVKVVYEPRPVDLISQIAYRDDSQPLVVKLGNPHLKGTSSTSMDATYTAHGRNQKQWHAGAAFKYHHRDVAQAVSYNPTTGVYTYQPRNISGAYNGRMDLSYSQAIDKKRYWTFQTNADAGYVHSLDHLMQAGDTESHKNAVNTWTLHDGAYVQYNRNQLNIRATGDISWRSSEGNMRDFSTLHALDFQYGLSARYTIPKLKTTVAADVDMYSRRGYGSAQLNTNDFVMNASVSQPFLKGKLIARIEAFDLLHHLSQTKYAVDAQGRTVTWYRSLPNYVMFHLVCHWNRNPKKGAGNAPAYATPNAN